MITVEELAEIIHRNTPPDVEKQPVEELAEEIRRALTEDSDHISLVHNIVKEIWQNGYDRGLANSKPG